MLSVITCGVLLTQTDVCTSRATLASQPNSSNVGIKINSAKYRKEKLSRYD